MIIDFIIYLVASIIGVSIVLFIFLISIRKWMKSNQKARKALFVFFDFQDYFSLVRDSYLKITEQKNKIQLILKNAIGKDETEVLNAFSNSYKELDDIMNHYLTSQAELEKKLFGEKESELK